MLTLRAGRASLVLAPEAGGAILGWSLGAVALLRPADANAVMRNEARGMGCFPLMPYANRIAAARFPWAGQAVRLARNFGDHPHSLHGLGWRRPWTVTAVAPAGATLSLAHDGTGPDWPFAFEAEQRFTLTPAALRIDLRIVNRHPAPAPAGLGLHPFFPRPAGASLRFAAASVWETDATALAVRNGPVPAAWAHDAGQTVGACALDHCFSGWDGHARLGLGSVVMDIEASDVFSHLQVFTPPGQRFFCVEPVTHRPDAINDEAGQGMHRLAANAALTGSVTFRISEP